MDRKTSLITTISLSFIILAVCNSAYAQSTIQQYCSNGTCNTGTVPVLNGINDTGKELQAKYNIIMIIPSEGCTNAIKYHMKTNCPGLQELVKYDNSNQKVSGYFYSMDGQTLIRSNPQVKNHWQYYTYTNKTIVCVYCTGNYLTTDLYKTIILQQSDSFSYVPHTYRSVPYHIPQFNSSSGSYTDYSVDVNEADSGLTAFLDRSVVGCNTATIAYSDVLLNDTIRYLESGCKVTAYNKTSVQKVPNSSWSYDNPYSTLHLSDYLKQINHGHVTLPGNHTVSGFGPGDCITKKCSYTDPYKKAGW